MSNPAHFPLRRGSFLRAWLRAFAVSLPLLGPAACSDTESQSSAAPPAPRRFSAKPISLKIPPMSRETGTALDPSAILFLPLVNRSEHPLHPGYLRNFDRSFALFASTRLQVPTVDPAVAANVATELGFPGPYHDGSAYSFAPDALKNAAAAVGAGLVVWGEILPAQQIRLHAAAVVPGVSLAPWDGVAIELAGPADAAFFTGPEQILSRLFVRTDSTGESLLPPTATEELEAALRLAAQLDPVAMNRAEDALSRLAARHPDWSRVWLEKASLQTQRALWAEGNDEPVPERMLRIAASPARHLARLLDPSAEEQARLQALDWYFLRQTRPASGLRTLLSALPTQAIERLVLAEISGPIDKEPFGLANFHPPSDSLGVLWMLEKRKGPWRSGIIDVVRAIEALPAEVHTSNTLLLNVMHAYYKAENDRGREVLLSNLLIRRHVAGGLDALRLLCGRLSGEAQTACLAPLSELLNGAAGEQPAIPYDAATPLELWDQGVARWLDRFDTANPRVSPAPVFAEIQPFPIFDEDPFYRNYWLRIAEYVQVSNRVLAEYAQRSRPLVPAGLATDFDPIRVVSDSLDPIFTLAFAPAWIPQMQGDKKLFWSYLAPLEAFQEHLVAAMIISHQRAQGRYALDEFAVLERAIAAAPTDTRWAHLWLNYLSEDYPQELPPEASRNAALRFEQMLPRLQEHHALLYDAWSRADEPARGLQRIDELEQATGVSFDPLVRDDFLAEQDAPAEERLERLLAAHGQYPLDATIALRLARQLLEEGRFLELNAVLEIAMAETSTQREGCSLLSEAFARQGDSESAGEQFRHCAETFTNRWRSARSWVDYAEGLRHRDRIDEAEAAYGKAEALLGGAEWILEGFARLDLLRGDYEAAIERHRKIQRRYATADQRNDNSRIELYWLLIRARRHDEAIEEIMPHARARPDHVRIWEMLGTGYHLAGRTAELIALCRNTAGDGPRAALIQELDLAGKRAEALALAEAQIAGEATEHTDYFRSVMADLLLADGRAEEAVERLAPHVERAAQQPHYPFFRSWIDALLALGRFDQAERSIEKFRGGPGRTTREWNRLEFRARVLAARGDGEGVRELGRRYRKQSLWQENPYGMETVWLEIEGRVPLPAPGSPEFEESMLRLDRTLEREFAEPDLWELKARFARHAGDEETARDAAEQAARFIRNRPDGADKSGAAAAAGS